MGKVLNLDALGSAQLHTTPYPWAHYEGAFSKLSLFDNFPTAGFEGHSQRRILEVLGKKGSDAWYQHNVSTRALLELGKQEPAGAGDLDDSWLGVVEDLLSVDYRECISDVTRYDVRSLAMQAHFWRFEGGAFFQPHVDKPHKVVTHLIYLTNGWTEDMGGCFRVLNSGDPSDIHTEIPPLYNDSIVLKRTDNAWHSVSPMPRECKRPRKLLQVWFWGDS